MAVEVGHGLRDDVVHRDKRALCTPRVSYRDREPLGALEERLNKLAREVGERFVVSSWHEQGVAVKDGPNVQECKADIVVEDDVRGLFARHDPAEEAVRQQS